MLPIEEKLGQDRGMPGWLELYDLSLHSDIEAQNPRGAYIKGKIGAENNFTPETGILGKTISKPAGMSSNPGWVVLETLEFHLDIEAVAPIFPYVHGEIDEQDHFYPDEPYEIISLP
ncbi:hypothetical protein NIES2119_25870 [[Phormidium ambiguum] IAM M-71]|uniref:Uncharacterized protein n=1 Tax=[Phormidium ambiguum] IAM M-71 TaxID=454136 RepID=A0A1U7I810_9CYAN|nr:hypothetical protein [Phormidium ambiguum]OKH32565.1 hypothetical protein NIES2119_25870 [Phormidium ambiguum IAM M-71]